MISFSKRAAKINLGSRLGQIVFQKLHQNLWGKSFESRFLNARVQFTKNELIIGILLIFLINNFL